MKTKKNDRYTYRVTWSEEDQEHVGLCAEFPSLSWLASSPEAALRGIRTVVAKVVKDMQANGEAIPEALLRVVSAESSWFAYRRKCIGSWPSKPPRQASASIDLASAKLS